MKGKITISILSTAKYKGRRVRMGKGGDRGHVGANEGLRLKIHTDPQHGRVGVDNILRL